MDYARKYSIQNCYTKEKEATVFFALYDDKCQELAPKTKPMNTNFKIYI
jgi:hypothetical protein